MPDETQQDNARERQARDAGVEGLRALGAAVQVSIRVLVAVLGLLLIVSLLQCYVVVKQHQIGIVYRFGKPRQELKPGQHALVLPPPFEEFRAYTVTREKSLETRAFLPAIDTATTASGAQLDAVLRPGVDGYLLTGDQNIIHCAATLYYWVSDPVAFYERQADGEKMLKTLLNHTLLRASWALGAEDTLFSLPRFAERVTSLLKEEIQASGLGAEVNRLVLNSTPPRQAKSAFDAHIAASQRADEARKQAEGYRARLANETDASADQVLALARSEKSELERKSQTRATTFEQVLVEYRKNPQIVRRELYMQTLRRVAENADETFIIEGKDGREIRMQLGSNPSAGRKARPEGKTP